MSPHPSVRRITIPSDVTGRTRRLGVFWARAADDFWRNLAYAWPVPALLAIWVLISSVILWKVEEEGSNSKIGGYEDALFHTFLAMFGENIDPATSWGRVLYASDALAGLVLF